MSDFDGFSEEDLLWNAFAASANVVARPPQNVETLLHFCVLLEATAWTPSRLSAAAWLLRCYSVITAGFLWAASTADHHPLSVGFHSAEVFISAALFQSRLLNVKSLFTIRSNYSA